MNEKRITCKTERDINRKRQRGRKRRERKRVRGRD